MNYEDIRKEWKASGSTDSLPLFDMKRRLALIDAQNQEQEEDEGDAE